MATYVWTGSSSSDFTDQLNWDPSTGAPTTPSDIAAFSTVNGPSETIDGNGAITGQIIIGYGNTLTLTGSLTTDGLPDPDLPDDDVGVIVDGSLVVADGASLTHDAKWLVIGDTANGSMTINGAVQSTHGVTVGLGANGNHTSSLTVSGSGASLNTSYVFGVDDSTIAVTDHGSLTSGSVYLGDGAGISLDDTASFGATGETQRIFFGYQGSATSGGVLDAVSDGSATKGQIVTVASNLFFDSAVTAKLTSDGSAVLNLTGSIDGGGIGAFEITGTGVVNLGSAAIANVNQLTVDAGTTLEFATSGTDNLGGLGSLTNHGSVFVAGGMDLENVATSNLSTGALTGGKWTVAGNSTIGFSGSAITSLGAVVAIGSGSTMETTDSTSTTTTLEQSLTTIASGGQLSLNRDFASTSADGLRVQGGGILLLQNGATLSGNQLIVDHGGKFGGKGTVAANVSTVSGSTITVSPAATLVFAGSNNSFGGTLSGSGTINISGLVSDIQSGTSLKSSALTLSGNTVTFDGNETYAGSLNIAASEYVALGGHKFNASKATTVLSNTTIENGTLYLGSGTVGGVVSDQTALIESGTLTLGSGAHLTVTGAVSGSGTIGGGGDSTIELGSAGAAAVSVSGATHFSLTEGDTLQLDNATLFRGLVSGFDTAANATIDVRSIATGPKEKLSYTDNGNNTGTLKVVNGTSHAAITLDGQFVASGFHLTADASGTGTAITYMPPPSGTPHLTVAHA